MNFDRYPWLTDLSSSEASQIIATAREQYRKTGAVTFPHFITDVALSKCAQEAREQEDSAFTTDDTHTAHLLPVEPSLPPDSVRNYEMRTKVASIAFDELPKGSVLADLYRHRSLRQLVSTIVHGESGDGDSDTSATVPNQLYLSEDKLGCCSINVFRPGYHHSFHFDESDFSTTLMLQEAADTNTGLFQYTPPLRQSKDDLALDAVAATLRYYCDGANDSTFCEPTTSTTPALQTLDFSPGTLSIFSGSKSLHRVTKVQGSYSRLVAVLTFSSEPGFRNSAQVQEMFWGRCAP